MNSGELLLANCLFYNNTLDYSSSNHNAWAGVTINKGSSLTDAGGNMQWPIEYLSPNNDMVTDEWLNQNPKVAQKDASLQSLSDNGGETPTMALSQGSPAIDAGASEYTVSIDQRGQARDGTGDIGAYEYTGK
jgi:hypothetical protein